MRSQLYFRRQPCLGLREITWNRTRILKRLPCMKTRVQVLLILALLCPGLRAQVPGSSPAADESSLISRTPDSTNLSAVPPLLGSSTNSLTADESTAYAALNRDLLELDAQFRLLNGLAREHRARAEELARDESQKSQWEAELATGFGAQASELLRRINERSRQRLAFEREHPVVRGSALAGFSSSGGTNGPNPDEVAYFAKIEERLQRAGQELAGVIEEGKLYAQQAHTNNAPDEIGRVSLLLNDNQRRVRELQKEQSDLELQLLGYRALRRR